jgi:hypothetical protein
MTSRRLGGPPTPETVRVAAGGDGPPTVSGGGVPERPLYAPASVVAHAPRTEPVTSTPQLDWADLPPTQNPALSLVQKARRFAFDKLPRDWALAQKQADTPVVSSVHRFVARMADYLEDALAAPTTRAALRQDRDAWVQGEQRIAERMRALTAQGVPHETALAQALEEAPDIGAVIMARRGRFARENTGYEALTGRALPESPDPYLPRIAEQSMSLGTRLRGRPIDFATDLQASLAGHHAARLDAGATLLETANLSRQEARRLGLDTPLAWGYIDPRQAWIRREWVGARLRATADLVDELRQAGVLYDSPEAARAAGITRPVEFTLIPTAQRRGAGLAQAADGLPLKTWWARSREEAQFLQNSFASTKSPLSTAVHYMNRVVRTPNLFNPIPHTARNMLVKYILGRGNPGRLPTDMAEWTQGTAAPGTNAAVDTFNRLFPHSHSGRIAQDILHDALASTDPRGVGKAVGQLVKAAEKPMAWSARAIFTRADPAMRYSLWKRYVDRYTQTGMPYEEAAQRAVTHVNVDLINYSTRSQLVDTWKSIPGNFFVPWRYGTVISVLKQARNHPIRTAFVVGAVDYLREAIYRTTGTWFHTPLDYLEGPMSAMIHDYLDSREFKQRDPATAAARALAYGGMWAASSMAFGPGGGYSAKQLGDILHTWGSGDPEGLKRLAGLWWGVAALGSGIHDAGILAQRWQQTGQVDPMALAQTMAEVLLASRTAVHHEPRRLMGVAERMAGRGAFEGLPGLAKSPQVQQADAARDYQMRRAVQARQRRDQQDVAREAIAETLTDRERRMRELTRGIR